MEIRQNTTSFKATFVENKALKKLSKQGYFNEATKDWAKKIVELPQKDKLELLNWETYHGIFYSLDVTIKNLTSGQLKKFRGFDRYQANVFNNLLEEIVCDAKDKSNFWSTSKKVDVVDILTGKS